MKRVALFFFTGCLWLISGEGRGQTLTVIVHGVKNQQGLVRVGIYKSEKEFMKTLWLGQSIKAKAGEVKLMFENVSPGSYAISIFHDANENGKLDTNFAGLPKEGFGFSNNAMGTLGPPSFEEAKFVFGGEKKMEITLKYR